MEERWFLIAHKKCGSVFTINSKNFLDGLNNPEAPRKATLYCPSCGYPAIPPQQVKMFLDAYNELINYLKNPLLGSDEKPIEYTIREIREIKEPIDSEKLDL